MKRILVLSVLLGLTANLASAKTLYDPFIHTAERKQESYFQKLLNVFHETPFDGSYAIIIAVGNYDTLPKLDAVKYDADKMKTFLLQTAEYDEVVVLKDADATFEAIRYFMDVYFPKKMATGRHRFFFYFSGHGTQREGARGAIGYLQLKEATREPNLDEIDMDQIKNWANKFRYANHILFLLDCCFSGLAGTEDKGYQTQVDPVELARKSGRFMITAGGADETSIASVKDWGGSLFTDVAISGMNGDADTNNDGVVTTYELFTYIQAAVVNEAKKVDHPQTPLLSNLGKTTDNGQYFFVYRNPESLSTPKPATISTPADQKKKGAEPTPTPTQVARTHPPTSTPTPQPTPAPQSTPTPTPQPPVTPMPQPTTTPTLRLTVTPTPRPQPTAPLTLRPTVTPTPTPIPIPTPNPELKTGMGKGTIVALSAGAVAALGGGIALASGGGNRGGNPEPTSEPTPEPCAGTQVGGYCWYLGEIMDSCTETCASHGGYHEATRTYAGSDGSANNCWQVLDALGVAPGTGVSRDCNSNFGVGCTVYYTNNQGTDPNGYRNYCMTPPTTPDASYGWETEGWWGGESRACACNN